MQSTLSDSATPSGLSWEQRITLFRHYFHVACRTNDFSFFKAFQAQYFSDGIDHIANLTRLVGEDADSLLWTLHNISTGIAYSYGDAFKTLYDALKSNMAERRPSVETLKAIYYVDALQQKQTACLAVDKMFNSATALIEQQSPETRIESACVLLMGVAFCADAVGVCLSQIDRAAGFLDDFIRLEECWSHVQWAVGASVGAMKSIFTLKALQESSDMTNCTTTNSSPKSSDSYAKGMLRKMSTVLNGYSGHAGPASTTTQSRRQSLASFQIPDRASISQACPVALPPKRTSWKDNHQALDTIPPTPGTNHEELMTNPFDVAMSQNLNNFSMNSNVDVDPTSNPETTNDQFDARHSDVEVDPHQKSTYDTSKEANKSAPSLSKSNMRHPTFTKERFEQVLASNVIS